MTEVGHEGQLATGAANRLEEAQDIVGIFVGEVAIGPEGE
jgi:hypothetical protein